MQLVLCMLAGKDLHAGMIFRSFLHMFSLQLVLVLCIYHGNCCFLNPKMSLDFHIVLFCIFYS